MKIIFVTLCLAIMALGVFIGVYAFHLPIYDQDRNWWGFVSGGLFAIGSAWFLIVGLSGGLKK